MRNGIPIEDFYDVRDWYYKELKKAGVNKTQAKIALLGEILTILGYRDSKSIREIIYVDKVGNKEKDVDVYTKSGMNYEVAGIVVDSIDYDSIEEVKAITTRFHDKMKKEHDTEYLLYIVTDGIQLNFYYFNKHAIYDNPFLIVDIAQADDTDKLSKLRKGNLTTKELKEVVKKWYFVDRQSRLFKIIMDIKLNSISDDDLKYLVDMHNIPAKYTNDIRQAIEITVNNYEEIKRTAEDNHNSIRALVRINKDTGETVILRGSRVGEVDDTTNDMNAIRKGNSIRINEDNIYNGIVIKEIYTTSDINAMSTIRNKATTENRLIDANIEIKVINKD